MFDCAWDSDMLDQNLHIYHEHIIVVIACTVVEKYVLETFCREFKGLIPQTEPIASLTRATASIGTCCHYLDWPFCLLPICDQMGVLERPIFLLRVYF